MRVFFQCVAEALAEQGIREWLKAALPGGDLFFDVAKGAGDKYRERKAQRLLRGELEQIAQASSAKAQEVAEAVVLEIACSERERSVIVTYLAQLPEAVRQTQRRSEDPSGHTLSAGLRLDCAEDLVQLLPAAMPRFVPGDGLPGMTEWRLERLLGIGGFGEVWYARHARLQSIPGGAVKFCHTGDLTHEAELIDRLLGCGSHPHIVALKEARLEGEPPWLMYEYIEGGDLGDLIHRWASLPSAERQAQVLTTLTTLSGAIGHFHAMQPPLVHRDLKPANILLGPQDHLQVTDFGIGGVAAQKTLATQRQSTVAGRLQSALYGSHTPLYASPQQSAGRAPDPRDDVHALGVIGYQMLTGQMIEGVGPDMAEDLEDLGIADGLIQLLRRCTARKPERRPADANAVRVALAGLATSGQTSSGLDALADQSLQFETVLLNAKGKIVRKPTGVARYFTEPLKGLGRGATPLEMIWIPAGTLQMGGNVYGDEKPIHPVQVPGFYMARMAVTQAQYQAVMEADPSHFKGANRPVEQVSWEEAQQFCDRLQGLTKRPYRLPSEAEWEYACRAGSTTPFHFGETITAEWANYNGNGIYAKEPKGRCRAETMEVGRFPPNGFGLHDMHGNVWEWCEDAWHDYNHAPTDGSAWEEGGEDARRVVRGGSWISDPDNVRCASRSRGGPGDRDDILGFRLALGSVGL